MTGNVFLRPLIILTYIIGRIGGSAMSGIPINYDIRENVKRYLIIRNDINMLDLYMRVMKIQ